MERLQHFAGVHRTPVHRVGERGRFLLCKGEENVLVGQQGVTAPMALLHRAIDGPLRRLTDLVLADAELVHGCTPDTRAIRARPDMSR